MGAEKVKDRLRIIRQRLNSSKTILNHLPECPAAKLAAHSSRTFPEWQKLPVVAVNNYIIENITTY